MYQKRHYGSCGPKPNHLFNQTDQLKSHNSYTQLHFENSLGKVQVCFDLLRIYINLKMLIKNLFCSVIIIEKLVA